MEDNKYYLIDASKKPLGRIATEVAGLLIGKNSPNFKPNVVPNVLVVVINSKNVYLSGTKESSKQYFNYSGYHGGLKTKTFSELKRNKPEELIKKAVKGMLPKNRLQNLYLKNLKIFTEDQHPYKNTEEIA